MECVRSIFCQRFYHSDRGFATDVRVALPATVAMEPQQHGARAVTIWFIWDLALVILDTGTSIAWLSLSTDDVFQHRRFGPDPAHACSIAWCAISIIRLLVWRNRSVIIWIARTGSSLTKISIDHFPTLTVLLISTYAVPFLPKGHCNLYGIIFLHLAYLIDYPLPQRYK